MKEFYKSKNTDEFIREYMKQLRNKQKIEPEKSFTNWKKEMLYKHKTTDVDMEKIFFRSILNKKYKNKKKEVITSTSKEKVFFPQEHLIKNLKRFLISSIPLKANKIKGFEDNYNNLKKAINIINETNKYDYMFNREQKEKIKLLCMLLGEDTPTRFNNVSF